MSGAGFSILKSFHSSINASQQTRVLHSCHEVMKTRLYSHNVRPSCAYVSQNCQRNESQSAGKLKSTYVRMLGLGLMANAQCLKPKHISSVLPSSNFGFHSTNQLSCLLNYRSFSSFFGSKDKSGGSVVSASSSTNEIDGSDSGAAGSELANKIKDVWQNVVDFTGQKAKEASDELTPHLQQLLDAHPYLKNVIIPVSCTLTATMLAWVVMPRLLRRLHKYEMKGPAALLPGRLYGDQVPYENSFWGALEDPIRYMITFMAFCYIAVMVAPTSIASQYLTQLWTGAAALSSVWFLHRWKTNVFTRALAAQTLGGPDRDKLLALDKLSSIGLFVIGLMALAEAFGVAVQSILTVGGIGGVATAFATRDILGNMFSGLSMQFSRPFSIGDTIKAGSIEGQVMEIGLTTTSLLNAEKFPVMVPNSLFSSQVIVNKSRAQWCAMVSKIPIHIDDLEKIPQISHNIKEMLRLNSNVFLGKEAPYCFLSRVENTFAELTLGCNLKHMRKDELYFTEQDILLQSVRIIKKHGGKLGNT